MSRTSKTIISLTMVFILIFNITGVTFAKGVDNITEQEEKFIEDILYINKITKEKIELVRNDSGNLEIIHHLNKYNYDVYTYHEQYNQENGNNEYQIKSISSLIRGFFTLYKIYSTGKTVCNVIQSMSGFDGCGYLLQNLRDGLSSKSVKYEVTRYFYKTPCPYPPNSYQCNSVSFGYWKTSYRRVN